MGYSFSKNYDNIFHSTILTGDIELRKSEHLEMLNQHDEYYIYCL